jgi:hypothetical protein
MKSAYIYDLSFLHSFHLVARGGCKVHEVLGASFTEISSSTHKLLHETSLVQADQRFAAVQLLLGFDKCNPKSGYEFQMAKKEMTR